QAQKDHSSRRHAVGDGAAGTAQASPERADAHAHGDGRRLHAGDPAGVTVGQAPAPGGRVPHVVEGHGYDLHQDCDVEIIDTYRWQPQAEIKRFEWEAGDVIYIPPCTIHQHFNADAARPARLISCTNRIYKNCGLNDLEQIENAPEYDPNVVLTAELVKDYLAARASGPA